MNEKRFTEGGILFIIGLLALYQGFLDGALFLCGLGIVIMTSADTEKALQLLDIFLNGFVKFLKALFPFF